MAGASRRLRPLRVTRLSTMNWILRAAPEGWTTGSMPANPLEAAAAMLLRAVVARAIAVVACNACEASAVFSAEPAPGVKSAWDGAGGVPRAAAVNSGDIASWPEAGPWVYTLGGGSSYCADGAREVGGDAACRSATAERAASISLRISSCISGVEAIVDAGSDSVA